MANRTNKSGNRQTGRKNKKNTSGDLAKFMLVIVLAGIAITLIILNQTGKNSVGTNSTPTTGANPSLPAEPTGSGTIVTPGAGTQVTVTVAPEITPELTNPAVPSTTVTPEVTIEPTAAPTTGITADNATAIVKQVVDMSVYKIELLNDHLNIDGKEYYHFCISQDSKDIDPFLIVDKISGTIYCYSFSGVKSDFVKFPLDPVSNPGQDTGNQPTEEGNITVDRAYQILCSYPKESLGLAKNVAEYDAEYDSELTLVKGSNCYRINLTEVSGGKIRNRGEYYISIDGEQCFTIDNDLNDFVLITK